MYFKYQGETILINAENHMGMLCSQVRPLSLDWKYLRMLNHKTVSTKLNEFPKIPHILQHALPNIPIDPT